MEIVSFDIETTGLSANDEVVSWATVGKIEGCKIQNSTNSEKDILDDLARTFNMDKGTVIITFNGQNFKGGFDFPHLRTRMHKHGIAWPFGGMMHIDIYPIIEKRWSTAQPYWQTLNQLLVDDLKQMILFFCIDGKGKTKQNYIDLISSAVSDEDINRYIREHSESKIKDINNLKGAYEIITGKDSGEMDGAESVKLWMQYKQTGDGSILEQIREYNMEDCKKTLELYNICTKYCSQRDMQPEIL